jgi:hypothetical protein
MSNLISRKIVKGNEISIYRIPILAGMQFTYTKGGTTNNELKKVGHYDYVITSNKNGETISEKKMHNVFYNNI